MKCLEAQHVFGNPLDNPVIQLKDVVEVFNLQDFNLLAVSRDFRIVFTACTPARLTLLLSMTILSGIRLLAMAL